ncbi:MAG: carbohydrate ABC transporter permease [Armatimonadota bacterium]|nr:carbohydrate ABC transporter permease [Armatimonadota bacterium]
MRRPVLTAALLAAATAYAVVVVVPFLWALRIALEPTYTMSVSLLPAAPSAENFRTLLRFTNFPRWVLNSLIFAGGVTVSNIALSTAAGYALARKRLPGREALFVAVIATMMIPGQVTLVPLYLLINRLGLLDTFPGLILPLAASGFGIFVMRQYMLQIPEEYEEAAIVDGCSRWGVFTRIVLPLARPAIFVVAVSTFMNTWNEFLYPLVMTSRDTMKVVTLGLADFTYATLNVNWGLTMAGSLLGALPPLILFAAFNRHFMQGLPMGGLRG